jgi:hypothetical protein
VGCKCVYVAVHFALKQLSEMPVRNISCVENRFG